MNLSDLIQGVPKENQKPMKEAAEALLDKGLLLRKPGMKKQFRYALNPSKKKEIEERVKKYLKGKGIDFRII